MTRILSILILVQLFSCMEKTKNGHSEKLLLENQTVTIHKKDSEKINNISQQEENFNGFIKSIETYKIQPIDTFDIENNLKKLENYDIGKNSIQIFKKDSLNIDWIKINSKKIVIKNLKTINSRVDGKSDEMFCNNIEKIKLYKHNNNEIIFLEFTSQPCTGLGCSVSDYLIYDVKNNQINLFGNFRTADLDFYNFPINRKLNYISTEYKRGFQEATPIHFVSRIYSLDRNGNFQIEKDLTGKEYYYEIITFPNDETKEFEYNRNWF